MSCLLKYFGTSSRRCTLMSCNCWVWLSTRTHIHERPTMRRCIELWSNHLYCVCMIVNMYRVYVNVYTYTKLPLYSDPITCVCIIVSMNRKYVYVYYETASEFCFNRLYCVQLSACRAYMWMCIHTRNCLWTLLQSLVLCVYDCQHARHIYECVYIYETASEGWSNHLCCVCRIVNMYGKYVYVHTCTKLPLKSDPTTCTVRLWLATCTAYMCMSIHLRSCSRKGVSTGETLPLKSECMP